MPSITAVLLGAQLLAMQTAEASTVFRGAAQLPGSLESFSKAMDLGASDPSTILLRAVSLLYGRSDVQAQHARTALASFVGAAELGVDRVPLPLNPELWTDVILDTRSGQRGLVPAILQNRTAALLYYGLSALDDETLQWVATNRATIVHFRKHPEIFAAFGRSIRVRDGRVLVPGGPDAELLWRSVLAVDPAQADRFVERLISGDGRVAFLYDVVAHLDDAHQRFALGLRSGRATRDARLRALLAAFTAAAPEWKIAERPFARPPLDGAILLSVIHVTADGNALPPLTRRLWDRVFRGDDLNDVAYEEISPGQLGAVTGSLVLDAPWLAERILRVPYAIGRRRLDALLFAQRVFHSGADAESSNVATALRGYLSFPALMIALERIGINDPAVYVRAAKQAAHLNAIEPVAERRVAIAEFQSAVELILRMERVHEITAARATSLVTSLIELEFSSRLPFGGPFAAWLRERLFVELPRSATLEESLIAAVSGSPKDPEEFPIVEWEGRRYLVSPPAGEFTRIRTIREAQHDDTVTSALVAESSQALANALISIVYAIHLGDPEAPAVASTNIALRHDFGLPVSPSAGSSDAWRLPIERFDGRDAWRIRGSLLGLEAALSRLALRRVDRTAMPAEPRLGAHDRQTVMMTAALSSPAAVSDESRDKVAAAIAHGRARVSALANDPSKLNEVAVGAGLSEWRRQALAWRVAEHRDPLATFSLLELFWVGHRRAVPGDALDAWGAAQLPLTGCLCLQLPTPSPWEDAAGYAIEMLAARGADVPLKIAETLSTLKLPAALAPALAGFVTQDVIDHAALAYPDDWEAFGRAVIDIPLERIVDYIAALTVSGPLVEIR